MLPRARARQRPERLLLGGSALDRRDGARQLLPQRARGAAHRLLEQHPDPAPGGRAGRHQIERVRERRRDRARAVPGPPARGGGRGPGRRPPAPRSGPAGRTARARPARRRPPRGSQHGAANFAASDRGGVTVLEAGSRSRPVTAASDPPPTAVRPIRRDRTGGAAGPTPASPRRPPAPRPRPPTGARERRAGGPRPMRCLSRRGRAPRIPRKPET